MATCLGARYSNCHVSGYKDNHDPLRAVDPLKDLSQQLDDGQHGADDVRQEPK